jgi:hypothetical protein
MKVLQTVKAAGGAMCALIMLTMAHSAHADVRFHYDSAPIPWNFTAINDWEDSTIGSQYKPDFSIFFDAPDSWAHPAETTIFTIPTPSIRMWNESAKFTIEPNGDQLVMVDPAGSILAWRFGYSLTPIFGPNADPRAVAINNRYDIYSTNSMGSPLRQHHDLQERHCLPKRPACADRQRPYQLSRYQHLGQSVVDRRRLCSAGTVLLWNDAGRHRHDRMDRQTQAQAAGLTGAQKLVTLSVPPRVWIKNR